MPPQERPGPKIQRERILAAALHLSQIGNYATITREQITIYAQCSPGLLNHYYSTMAQLRRDVMRAAVRLRIGAIVAQGLVAKDPIALKAPEDLKKQAAASITS